MFFPVFTSEKTRQSSFFHRAPMAGVERPSKSFVFLWFLQATNSTKNPQVFIGFPMIGIAWFFIGLYKKKKHVFFHKCFDHGTSTPSSSGPSATLPRFSVAKNYFDYRSRPPIQLGGRGLPIGVLKQQQKRCAKPVPPPSVLPQRCIFGAFLVPSEVRAGVPSRDQDRLLAT